MIAGAAASLRGRKGVRSSSASADAMAVRNVRNAAEVVVRSSNGRLSSSVLHNSSPRLRRPRGNGREGVAGVVAAEIAAKSRLRIRTLPLRSSNRVSRGRRANRVLLARHKRRVRMPREHRRRVRKVTVRNGAVVFAVVEVVGAAGRKALRRRHSRYASSVTISISTVAPIWNSDLS